VQEWEAPQPSKRPDIFPEFDKPERVFLPKPLPGAPPACAAGGAITHHHPSTPPFNTTHVTCAHTGDPEMPDEEEEESRKRTEPGDPDPEAPPGEPSEPEPGEPGTDPEKQTNIPTVPE
jgi:hypothetical protein